MTSLNDYIAEYKKQIAKGDIKLAYQGLMEYIMQLRVHLKNKYPDFFVSGSIYQGYMDISYFAFFPESLKSKKLKIAIIFNHELIRFEIWLAGYNKSIQKKYWNLFKKSDWDQYRIPASVNDVYSIVEHTLVENPDFNNPTMLTRQIEDGALKFIADIQAYILRS